jgi:DNA-binding winged helix-turn-helix (wHTH) protein
VLAVIVRFGEWTLDSDQRLITGEHDIVVHLTPKAFDLLSVLVEAAPRVVRKDELHRRLWPGVFVSDATLAGLVKEVRHAFREPDHELSIIRTVHGVGYAFAAGMGSLLAANEFPDYWVIVGDRRVHLTSKEVVIGRDAASDVRLDSAGVSRRHARILMTSRGAYLEDLGSKNGTMLDGKPCAGPTPLLDGDTIRLGPVSIVFRFSDSKASTQTVVIE